MIFATGTPNAKRAAFTLVELLLVMTMMVIVMAVVFPSLKGFFHGRNLDNEARRFLSLTRYGRSRAIAEGVPIELWLNPHSAQYGLQALQGYTETRTDPRTFSVDQTVQLTLSAPSTVLTRSNVWTQTSAQAGNVTKIRFQPDGFISDSSPENIFFREQDTGQQVWIAESATHSKYEIKTGQPPGR